MLESLEPWGNVFVSCLVWRGGGNVLFQLHCNLLNALLLMCFMRPILEYFFFHHKHRTPKGWRVRREGHCWLVRTLLWCSPAWYWITLLNTSYCVVVTTVIHKLWMNQLTGWIFHVRCWLYNIMSMLGQSFVTRWTWDVCCWLYNNISMPGHDVYRQAQILLCLPQTGVLVVVSWFVSPSRLKEHYMSKRNQSGRL